MRNFVDELDVKIKQAENSLCQLKEALETTNQFLKECEKEGIKTVSIGLKTKKIKSTNGWPFGFSNSVFADKKTKRNKNSGSEWPAIWRVCEKFDFNGGCGNSGQHSISSEAKLIEGIYSFKKGKWHKTDK